MLYGNYEALCFADDLRCVLRTLCDCVVENQCLTPPLCCSWMLVVWKVGRLNVEGEVEPRALLVLLVFLVPWRWNECKEDDGGNGHWYCCKEDDLCQHYVYASWRLTGLANPGCYSLLSALVLMVLIQTEPEKVHQLHHGHKYLWGFKSSPSMSKPKPLSGNVPNHQNLWRDLPSLSFNLLGLVNQMRFLFVYFMISHSNKQDPMYLIFQPVWSSGQ